MGTCSVCGREFRYLKSGYSGRYCSRKCKYEGFKKPDAWVTRTCLRCGKEYIARTCSSGNKKYCSIDCYGRTKREVRLSCVICGKPFVVNPSRATTAKCCSVVCQNEWQKKHHRKRPLDQINRFGQKGWRRVREQVLDRDGWACQRCGDTHYLSVHHIVPWIVSHDDSPDNLVTLCGACHFMADTGHRLNLAVEHAFGA